jgi:hypothetical protein
MAANAVPVKAGSKCSVIGALENKSDKTYTCVKSGSKKVWDTGVAPVSFDNLNPKLVRKTAYSQIVSEVIESKPYISTLEFILGPSLPKSRADKEIVSLKRVATFWSDIYTPAKVYIGYYTEKDGAWVDNAYCSQINFCPSNLSQKISNTTTQDPNDCSNAMATRTKDQIPFFYECLGKGSDEVRSKNIGAHEYTHLAQRPYYDFDILPNWIIEGSATYFGTALGSWKGNNIPASLDENMNFEANSWSTQDLCPLKQITLETIENCMKFTHQVNNGSVEGSRWTLAHVSYYMGSLMTEALIAVKGLAAFKKFMTDLKDTSYENAFVSNFGISSDAFYVKASKYVLAMYKAGR